MEAQFWHSRWLQNEIGFHEQKVHALLQKYWDRLGLTADARVLVPLCGKSLDMLWLRERGHDVIGAELSEIAVRDFFAENGLTPAVQEAGRLDLWTAPGIELYCGDFLHLTGAQVGDVAGAYDRAALIALPPAMRLAYATHLLSLLAPDARLLLITLQYPDGLFDGPPFAVSHAEIAQLFGLQCRIDHLEQSMTTVKGRFEVMQSATMLVKNIA